MKPSDPLVSTLQEWIEVSMRRSMQNFYLFLKENGISMSQTGALFHIRRRGACGVSDIGDDLGVTSAAASQMLERLVQQDLIARSEHPHDRRFRQVVLTEKGRHIVQQGILARQSWVGELADALSPAEQVQAIATLKILIQRVNEIEEYPDPQPVP
jgi:DNA-binding MarR family transcriptional regulator